MSSKDWIDKTIKKPGAQKAHAEPEQATGKAGKRARLVEMLLNARKEKR